MKKNIYVKPDTVIMTVETEAMMAASGDFSATFSDDDKINEGYVDAKKHYNVWGFDEEED